MKIYGLKRFYFHHVVNYREDNDLWILINLKRKKKDCNDEKEIVRAQQTAEREALSENW